jgi:hypothetical protein
MKHETDIEVGPDGMARRRLPGCVNDFLRFQVGRMCWRPMEIAQYETLEDGSPGRLLGVELNTAYSSKVFKLLGYGATSLEAEQMAQKWINKNERNGSI